MQSDFIPNKLFAVGGGVKNKIWTSSISNISCLSQELKSKTIGASYGNSFLAAFTRLLLATTEQRIFFFCNSSK